MTETVRSTEPACPRCGDGEYVSFHNIDGIAVYECELCTWAFIRRCKRCKAPMNLIKGPAKWIEVCVYGCFDDS